MKGIALALAVLAALGLTAAASSTPQARGPTFPASWNATWSPNGKQLVFATNRLGNDDLWLMTPRGRNQRPLTRGRAIESSPTWSPDGSQVAFVSDRTGRGKESHVYVIHADGTRERQVTTGSGWDSSPDWSPDGTKLVFAR